MSLAPGEYVFECTECKGDGNLQVITEDDGAPDGVALVWEQCFECYGDGTVHLDEDEAAEMIECGWTPLRTPNA